MSSLIVLLPSSDALAPGGWEATPMPFALLGRKGEALRTGRTPFEGLPKAGQTILVVAARDTLLLNAQLPQVTGLRLRRALPNVVEEHLIQDAQRCHIAIDPVVLDSGERCLAVIDRDWFASILAGFAEAGHRRIRAVPLIHCLPAIEPLSAKGGNGELATATDVQAAQKATGTSATKTKPAPAQKVAEEAMAAVEALYAEGSAEEPAAASEAEDDVAHTAATASVLIVRRGGGESSLAQASMGGGEWVELALRQGALGFGISVNAAQLDATLDELAQRQPLAVYSLAIDMDAKADVVRPDGGIEPDAAAVPSSTGGSLDRSAAGSLAERPLPMANVASMALACRFNLCQFEFANTGRTRPGEGGLKPWRVAVGFLAASMLVSIVALNVQWFQLRHKRDALTEQMTQLVKGVFPNVTIVLEPHDQMTRELTRLRADAGEVGKNDFLPLASGLAHALSPIPSTSIAEMNYSGGALDVTFKPGTEIDEDGLKRRFAANGLSAHEDDGKWIVKPAQSKPH
jgi:general secretion pathway protein L